MEKSYRLTFHPAGLSLQDVLRVNGKTIPWHEGMTFPEIFAALGYTLSDPLVTVRVNGRRVDKGERDDFRIPDGASVEIINKLRGG